MRYLTIEEIHEEEAEILKQFIKFCDKNQIIYYICGGTLLGAIRHKGFIPWDDDIDIMMPRKEFIKFEKLTQNKKIGDELEVISFYNGKLHYPFCKVINKKIKADDQFLKDKSEQFLWIDIFPMDGIPEDSNKNEKLYKKVIKTRKMIKTLYAEDSYIEDITKSKIKKILKKILRLIATPGFKKKIIEKLDKLSQKYNYDKSKYVGGVLWGYGPQEKLLKSEIQNYKVEFEGMQVNTISCYDKYLTNLYGDYMKLPPLEARISHEIKLYRIGENGNGKNINNINSSI